MSIYSFVSNRRTTTTIDTTRVYSEGPSKFKEADYKTVVIERSNCSVDRDSRIHVVLDPTSRDTKEVDEILKPVEENLDYPVAEVTNHPDLVIYHKNTDSDTIRAR